MKVARLVAFALAVPLVAAHAQGNSTPNKSEVQQILNTAIDALNQGDQRTWAESFTSDATMLRADGMMLSGRSEIVKNVQVQNQVRVTVVAVTIISPNALLVDATHESTAIVSGGRPGRSTLILVREGNGWKIFASRGMVPQGS